MTCRRLARVSADHPPTTVDLSSDGVHPEACRRYIESAKGAIVTLVTARHQHRTACDAASARRFRSGVRCTQVVPYTAGPAALRLASCLPNLRHLALHEATSCLGGMTDEFAAAVAAHCPLLTTLEVAFTRYSLPSEFFTDAGMMALAAGCPLLTSLSLTNCGAITNRSLYAVAVHCRGLRSLALGGYHELVTDYGTVVLFQACTSLERVVLSGKLRRVTDESAEALAVGSGATLREVKLTRSMGDKALAAFASHCKALRLVDCCKCEPAAITPDGVASLLRTLAAAAAQPPDPASPAVPAAVPADATIATPARTCGGTRDAVRVLLPPGLPAADVIQMGPGRGEGHAGAAWRAVGTSMPAASSSPQPIPCPAVTGRTSPSSGSASSSPAAASPATTPSSSLASSPSSTSAAHAWVNGDKGPGASGGEGGGASALGGGLWAGGAKGAGGAARGNRSHQTQLLINPAGLCGARHSASPETPGSGVQEVLVYLRTS